MSTLQITCGDTVKRTALGAADIGMADMASVIIGRSNALYVFAIKNPEAAANAFVKHFPESSRDQTLAEWKITNAHMLTDRTRRNGIGYIDRSKMEKTLQLVMQYQQGNADLKVDDIYSMKFLSKIEAGQ